MDTKKTIAGTGIAILLATAGMTGEFYVNKDEKLLDKDYTTYEYHQIREQIGEKGSQDNLNYKELELFVAVLNKEKEKCGGKLHKVNSNEDIRNLVKNFDKNGCPQ